MAVATQTVTTRLPEFQEQYMADLLTSAQNLFKPVSEGGQGLTMPFVQSQLAGLSEGQQQAIQQAMSGVGSYQPFLQQGEAAMLGGLDSLGQAQLASQAAALGIRPEVLAAQQGIEGGVQPSAASTAGAQAGLGEAAGKIDPALQGGMGQMQQALQGSAAATAAGQAGLGQAGQFGMGAAQQGIGQLTGSAAQYDPSGVSQFMDPYLEDVVQRAQSDIGRQGRMQENQARARAVGSGAFGGSRAAVLEGEIGRNTLEQQARTGERLRSQGYQQAQQAAMSAFEAARRRQQQQAQLTGALGQAGAQTGMTAASSAAGLGQKLGQQGIGVGQTGAQLGLSGAQLGGALAGQSGALGQKLGAQQMAGAQTSGQLGLSGQQLAGQLAGQSGSLAGQQAGIGGQLAGLGQLGQQLGVQDINTMLGIGGLQQGQAQQALNIAQQNALAQQQLPFQQLGFLGDIFAGVPALQQTTSQNITPPPSAMSQILGLGIAGLGAAGQAGGIGNLFNFGTRATS